MALRAYWSGHLRLSLVSIAVELYAATESGSRLTLHQIHKPTGKRIRYERVVPDHGPVGRDEIIKGAEVEKGRYVTLEPEELEEIKLESQRTVDLVQFVGYDEIDPRYFNRPYYVVPDGKVAAEGFVVIREALARARKIGLGEVAMRGREYLVAVRPCGRGMLMETLRYADEVRDTEQVFDSIPEVDLDTELVDLATELIDRKTAPFQPEKFEDNYARALQELVEQRRQGQHVVGVDARDQPKRGAEVIDLMDALKRSVSKDKPQSKSGGRKSATAKSGASRAKKAGQGKG